MDSLRKSLCPMIRKIEYVSYEELYQGMRAEEALPEKRHGALWEMGIHAGSNATNERRPAIE